MPATAMITQPKSEDLKKTFALANEHFGHIPNLVKVLASNPTMCQSVTAFFSQALREGRVTWAFKELVILKTFRAIKAYYSYGAHERLALELGNSAEKIGDIANSLWKKSPHFTDKERVVFELVEQIGEDANNVSNDLWKRLKSHWNHGQLLELTAVITTFVMIGRLGDTLGVSETILFKKPIR